MKPSNRTRILAASVELFNRSGTVVITTNHIAKALKISPGNLYFHFQNREEIIRELFATHCRDLYVAWNYKLGLPPREILERSSEVFWTYRFFHREMYHLRRQDPKLARAWKHHMSRCYALLKLNYRHWVSEGWVKPIEDAWEMRALSNSVLLSSSAFLGFFESSERVASRKSLRAGVDHVDRLLSPYYTSKYRELERVPSLARQASVGSKILPTVSPC